MQLPPPLVRLLARARRCKHSVARVAQAVRAPSNVATFAIDVQRPLAARLHGVATVNAVGAAVVIKARARVRRYAPPAAVTWAACEAATTALVYVTIGASFRGIAHALRSLIGDARCRDSRRRRRRRRRRRNAHKRAFACRRASFKTQAARARAQHRSRFLSRSLACSLACSPLTRGRRRRRRLIYSSPLHAAQRRAR